jgi:hypothetical protein
MPDNLEKLRDEMGLAVVAIGTALAQTIVELDEQSEALGILRQRAENIGEHLRGLGQHNAVLILTAFINSLHEKRFFPGHPDTR